MKPVRLLAALSLALTCAFARAQTEVTVYTYNDKPPFVIDKDKQDGIEYRLCQWLTKESGTYRFTLKVVTASEAKGMVEKDELKGVLMGVNKMWFPEPVRNRYLWTPAVLWDKNLVVSTDAKKVEYTGPASLFGLKLAGVKGYAYPALTEAVTAGKLERVDNATEIASLGVLGAHKVDVAIVSEWTLLYMRFRGDLANDIYESNKPFSEYERCILVPPSQKALHEHLSKLLADVRKNDGWQKATSL